MGYLLLRLKASYSSLSGLSFIIEQTLSVRPSNEHLTFEHRKQLSSVHGTHGVFHKIKTAMKSVIGSQSTPGSRICS